MYHKIMPTGVVIFALMSGLLYAKETLPFDGVVTADNINIRTDSTTSAQIICAVNRDERILVTSELYDWYKIALPKTIPVFITDSFVDSKNAKVTKDRVNIRLKPDISSAAIGTAQNGQKINILEHLPGWYKIEPFDGCFGWVHKKFIAAAKPKTQKSASVESQEWDNVAIEGKVLPYGMSLFKRQATHKLITDDKNIFLLKGKKEDLGAVTTHRVKLTGKIIPGLKQKYPVVEVVRIDRLD